MENGLPLETTRNLVEKENAWENQGDEKNSKKNIVHLMKNNLLEFAENVGWIQVGKKGKKKSPSNIRSHSISKQEYKGKWIANMLVFWKIFSWKGIEVFV